MDDLDYEELPATVDPAWWTEEGWLDDDEEAPDTPRDLPGKFKAMPPPAPEPAPKPKPKQTTPKPKIPKPPVVPQQQVKPPEPPKAPETPPAPEPAPEPAKPAKVREHPKPLPPPKPGKERRAYRASDVFAAEGERGKVEPTQIKPPPEPPREEVPTPELEIDEHAHLRQEMTEEDKRRYESSLGEPKDEEDRRLREESHRIVQEALRKPPEEMTDAEAHREMSRLMASYEEIKHSGNREDEVARLNRMEAIDRTWANRSLPSNLQRKLEEIRKGHGSRLPGGNFDRIGKVHAEIADYLENLDQAKQWNGRTVPLIAQSVYLTRSYDQLPVLADALEDAGFADQEVLQQLRSGSMLEWDTRGVKERGTGAVGQGGVDYDIIPRSRYIGEGVQTRFELLVNGAPVDRPNEFRSIEDAKRRAAELEGGPSPKVVEETLDQFLDPPEFMRGKSPKQIASSSPWNFYRGMAYALEREIRAFEVDSHTLQQKYAQLQNRLFSHRGEIKMPEEISARFEIDPNITRAMSQQEAGHYVREQHLRRNVAAADYFEQQWQDRMAAEKEWEGNVQRLRDQGRLGKALPTQTTTELKNEAKKPRKHPIPPPPQVQRKKPTTKPKVEQKPPKQPTEPPKPPSPETQRALEEISKAPEKYADDDITAAHLGVPKKAVQEAKTRKPKAAPTPEQPEQQPEAPEQVQPPTQEPQTPEEKKPLARQAQTENIPVPKQDQPKPRKGEEERPPVERLVAGIEKQGLTGEDLDEPTVVDLADKFGLPEEEVRAALKKVKKETQEEPKRGAVYVGLSTVTPNIPDLKELNDAAAGGDAEAGEILNKIAMDSLKHLTVGVPSVKLEFVPVTGLYGGDVEVSLGVKMEFDETDRTQALQALAGFARDFRQEQVHVRGDVAKGSRAGRRYDDGSYNTPFYRINLKNALSRQEIEAIIKESGLYGLSVGPNFLEAYYVGDPKDAESIATFRASVRRAVDAVGANGAGVQQGTTRLWVYGRGGGAVPYREIVGDNYSRPADATVARIVQDHLAERKAREEGTARSALTGGGLELARRKMGQFLTAEELHGVRRDVKERILKMYEQVPPDAEWEEMAELGMSKKGWYEDAARWLAGMFGPDTARFVALLAAKSPQNPVEKNLISTFVMWNAWVEEGKPTEVVIRKDADGKDIKWMPFWDKLDPEAQASFGAYINNSVEALTNPDVSKIKLDGYKVESFRRNLMGEKDQVTNDIWMAYFAGVDQRKWFSTRAGYLAMTARCRKIAKKMGLTPEQVQETIWSSAKALSDMMDPEKGNMTPEEAARRAALDEHDVRNTVDFVTQLRNNPRVKELLKDAGIQLDPRPNNSAAGAGGPASSATTTPQPTGASGLTQGISEDGDPRRDQESLARRTRILTTVARRIRRAQREAAKQARIAKAAKEARRKEREKEMIWPKQVGKSLFTYWVKAIPPTPPDTPSPEQPEKPKLPKPPVVKPQRRFVHKPPEKPQEAPKPVQPPQQPSEPSERGRSEARGQEKPPVKPAPEVQRTPKAPPSGKPASEQPLPVQEEPKQPQPQQQEIPVGREVGRTPPDPAAELSRAEFENRKIKDFIERQDIDLEEVKDEDVEYVARSLRMDETAVRLAMHELRKDTDLQLSRDIADYLHGMDANIHDVDEAGIEELSQYLDKSPERVRELVRTMQQTARNRGRTAKEIVKSLTAAKVVDKRRMPTTDVSVSYKLRLEDGGYVIYKPSNGEPLMRRGIAHQTMYKREVAAYEMAAILGWGDLVPPTVVRDHEGDIGSFQQFVDNAVESGLYRGDDNKVYDGPEDALRCAVFDYLLASTDRHNGNWMIDRTTGKLTLIDNGASLPHIYSERDFVELGQFLFWKHAVKSGFQIPDLSSWKGKWPKVSKALKKLGIEEGAIVRARERFDDLIAMKGRKFGDLPSMVTGVRNMADLVRRVYQTEEQGRTSGGLKPEEKEAVRRFLEDKNYTRQSMERFTEGDIDFLAQRMGRTPGSEFPKISARRFKEAVRQIVEG